MLTGVKDRYPRLNNATTMTIFIPTFYFYRFFITKQTGEKIVIDPMRNTYGPFQKWKNVKVLTIITDFPFMKSKKTA